jgi:hypothetical protein
VVNAKAEAMEPNSKAREGARALATTCGIPICGEFAGMENPSPRKIREEIETVEHSSTWMDRRNGMNAE